MAAIQPKNTTDIKVNKITAKTSTDVNLNDIVTATAAALVPNVATVDLGTSTGAEHVREVFAKEVSSNGQDLVVGTDSAHNVVIKRNGLTILTIGANGDITVDATNGRNILLTRQSSYVCLGAANEALTATGTNLATALQLTGFYNQCSTVASGTAVKCDPLQPINSIAFLVNAGANALLLFPPTTSEGINGGTLGNSVSIATNALVTIVRTSLTNFVCREITSAAA